MKELNMVIHALTKAGFKLKPSKCKIAYLAIQFMGACGQWGPERGVSLSKRRSLLRCKDQGTGKRGSESLRLCEFFEGFLFLCILVWWGHLRV